MFLSVFFTVVLSAQLCFRSGCFSVAEVPWWQICTIYCVLLCLFIFFNLRPASVAESVKVVYFRKQQQALTLFDLIVSQYPLLQLWRLKRLVDHCFLQLLPLLWV